MLKPIILILSTMTPILPVYSQVYKWVDEQGVTHYGATPPPSSSPHQTLTIDQASGNSISNSVAPSRTETTQQIVESVRLLQKMNAPQRSSDEDEDAEPSSLPADISYDDELRIRNLEKRIEALSSSTIGSPLSRKREIDAAKTELAGIYAKYRMYPQLRDPPPPVDENAKWKILHAEAEEREAESRAQDAESKAREAEWKVRKAEQRARQMELLGR